MFKKFLFLSVATAFLAACSGSSNSGGSTVVPTAAGGIYGIWKYSKTENNVTVDLTLNIEESITYIRKICTANGSSVEIATTVPSQVKGNTYSTLREIREDKDNGAVSCPLNLPAITLSFEIQGNQLVLSAGGEKLNFTFVGKNPATERAEKAAEKTKTSEPVPTPVPAPAPTPNTGSTTSPTPMPQPAPSPAPESTNSLYGNWASTQNLNGFVITMTLNIGVNSTTVSNTCQYQGDTASASVVVQSKVEGNTYQFLTAGKNESKSNGGLTCSVNIPVGTLNFVITGNKVTFTVPGGQDKIVFDRLN